MTNRVYLNVYSKPIVKLIMINYVNQNAGQKSTG